MAVPGGAHLFISDQTLFLGGEEGVRPTKDLNTKCMLITHPAWPFHFPF